MWTLLSRCQPIPLAAIAWVMVGCGAARAPLNLTSMDPMTDQRTIADYYKQDAETLRLKSRALIERIAVYQHLFGPDSEWVIGARLLAEYYEQAAINDDHQALMHLSIADDRPFWMLDRRRTRHEAD